MKKRFRYYLFLLLITPICLEIALRILGYSPYKQTEYSISSKPNMCLQASKELGFSLGEGAYEVSVNGAPAYTATQVNGRRITRYESTEFCKGRIFVMGCSFTYGMGVADSISFPFQLQQKFDSLDVQNFGVPGFGNVQSFLQLENEIQNGNNPDLVVVNFCDFHHQRNSLTPRFRNSLVLGYQRSNKEVTAALAKSKFPYIENGKLKTVNFENLYYNWLGRETFASVHYFQSMNDKRLTSKINLEKNSLALFIKMKQLCDLHDIELLVTGLTKNHATLTFMNQLKHEGINTLDISLDLRMKKYNQLPYDSHPNNRAHTYFAEKLVPVIEKMVVRMN